MIEKAEMDDESRAIDDTDMSSTYTMNTALTIRQLLEGREQITKVYHVTSDGYCFWFELAKTTLNPQSRCKLETDREH